MGSKSRDELIISRDYYFVISFLLLCINSLKSQLQPCGCILLSNNCAHIAFGVDARGLSSTFSLSLVIPFQAGNVFTICFAY